MSSVHEEYWGISESLEGHFACQSCGALWISRDAFRRPMNRTATTAHISTISNFSNFAHSFQEVSRNTQLMHCLCTWKLSYAIRCHQQIYQKSSFDFRSHLEHFRAVSSRPYDRRVSLYVFCGQKRLTKQKHISYPAPVWSCKELKLSSNYSQAFCRFVVFPSQHELN